MTSIFSNALVKQCLCFGVIAFAMLAGFAQDQIPSVDWTLETMDGASENALAIVSIQNQMLQTERDGQPKSHAFGDLRRLRRPNVKQLNTSSQFEIGLREGSILRTESLVLNKGRLVLDGPIKCQIDTSRVAYVRLRELTEAQRGQWENMLAAQTSGDRLIIRRSEDALDQIEGLILGIEQQLLMFEFSDQKIDIPFDKLAGFCFFGRKKNVPTPVAVLKTRLGDQIACVDLEAAANSSNIEVTVGNGIKIQIPRSLIEEIDFSMASSMELVDLPLVSPRRKNHIALSAKVAGLNDSLAPKVTEASSENADKRYLTFNGSGEASFDIPTDYSRLTGNVTLSPTGSQITACQVSVAIERKTVWTATLEQINKPVSIDLPIEAGKRLTLSVLSKTSPAVGDVVKWRDLRLMK